LRSKVSCAGRRWAKSSGTRPIGPVRRAVRSGRGCGRLRMLHIGHGAGQHRSDEPDHHTGRSQQAEQTSDQHQLDRGAVDSQRSAMCLHTLDTLGGDDRLRGSGCAIEQDRDVPRCGCAQRGHTAGERTTYQQLLELNPAISQRACLRPLRRVVGDLRDDPAQGSLHPWRDLNDELISFAAGSSRNRWHATFRTDCSSDRQPHPRLPRVAWSWARAVLTASFRVSVS
jgi:hypothetical protein